MATIALHLLSGMGAAWVGFRLAPTRPCQPRVRWLSTVLVTCAALHTVAALLVGLRFGLAAVLVLLATAATVELLASPTDRAVARARSRRRDRRGSAVPLFSTPVLGVRLWRVGPDGLLYPLGMGFTPWRTGVNTARCLRVPHEHEAPDEQCECGFYALHPDPSRVPLPSPLLNETPLLVGAVAGWGRMQVHHDGWRAEHVCVLALAVPPWGLDRDGASSTQAELIAAEYGVPCVPYDQLLAATDGAASALPASGWPPTPWPERIAARAAAGVYWIRRLISLPLAVANLLLAWLVLTLVSDAALIGAAVGAALALALAVAGIWWRLRYTPPGYVGAMTGVALLNRCGEWAVAAALLCAAPPLGALLTAWELYRAPRAFDPCFRWLSLLRRPAQRGALPRPLTQKQHHGAGP